MIIILTLSLSLKLHDGREARGHLVEVMLGQPVRAQGHPQGGGGELPHHGRREGAKGAHRGVQLVLHARVVALLQRSSLLRPPVLEPNFNLRKGPSTFEWREKPLLYLLLGHVETCSHLCPLCGGKIFRSLETLLQLEYLFAGESCPHLFLIWTRVLILLCLSFHLRVFLSLTSLAIELWRT